MRGAFFRVERCLIEEEEGFIFEARLVMLSRQEMGSLGTFGIGANDAV